MYDVRKARGFCLRNILVSVNVFKYFICLYNSMQYAHSQYVKIVGKTCFEYFSSNKEKIFTLHNSTVNQFKTFHSTLLSDVLTGIII